MRLRSSHPAVGSLSPLLPVSVSLQEKLARDWAATHRQLLCLLSTAFYVCTHVCMPVCVYRCVRACMCVCTRVCVRACMHVCLCIPLLDALSK